MDRIEYNVVTGIKTIVTMTQAEIDAIPPLSAEQIALLAQITLDKLEQENIKIDAVIRYLISHTNAEIETYIKNQIKAQSITTNAEAITSIKVIETMLVKLAQAVSVLGKGALR